MSSDGDGGRRTGVVPGAPWTSRRLLQQDRLDFVPRMRHKIVARASNKTNDINSTMDSSTGNCSLEKRSFKMVLTQRLKAVHCRRPRLVRPARSPLGPPDFENYQRFPHIALVSHLFKYLMTVLSKVTFYSYLLKLPFKVTFWSYLSYLFKLPF